VPAPEYTGIQSRGAKS